MTGQEHSDHPEESSSSASQPHPEDAPHIEGLIGNDLGLGDVLVSLRLQGVLGYEMRSYARKMQMRQTDLVRFAVKEYLERRGIYVT